MKDFTIVTFLYRGGGKEVGLGRNMEFWQKSLPCLISQTLKILETDVPKITCNLGQKKI